MPATKHTTENNTAFVHPEQRIGEVFFANACNDWFAAMPFSTKRLGDVAFDGVGRMLSADSWHPVFVHESEIAATGHTLAELRAVDRESRAS